MNNKKQKNELLENINQTTAEEEIKKVYNDYIGIKKQLNGNKDGKITFWIKIKNYLYSKTHNGKTKTEMITEKGGEYWSDIFQKKSFVFIITAIVAIVFSVGILCGQYLKGSFAYEAMNNSQESKRILFVVILGVCAFAGIVLTIMGFTFKKYKRNRRLQNVNQRKLMSILNFLESETLRHNIDFDFKRIKDHLKIMDTLNSKEKQEKQEVDKEIKVKKKTKSSKNNAAQQMLLLICVELNFVYKICKIKRNVEIICVKMDDEQFTRILKENFQDILIDVKSFYKEKIIENMKYDGIFQYENEVVNNKLETFSIQLKEFSQNVDEQLSLLAEGKW